MDSNLTDLNTLEASMAGCQIVDNAEKSVENPSVDENVVQNNVTDLIETDSSNVGVDGESDDGSYLPDDSNFCRHYFYNSEDELDIEYAESSNVVACAEDDLDEVWDDDDDYWDPLVQDIVQTTNFDTAPTHDTATATIVDGQFDDAEEAED